MLEGGEDAALHRAAHGHPGQRGHRQRRPAGAARWPSPRRRPSSTSGMPEAQHALAQAAIYLALAPKSNAAYRRHRRRARHVREHGAQAPPAALQPPRRTRRARARPGAGLRLPARPPRARLGAGADARRARRRALLRARRRRGEHARPPVADPRGARRSRTRTQGFNGSLPPSDGRAALRHPPPPRGGGRGPAPPAAPAQPATAPALRRPARAPRAARLDDLERRRLAARSTPARAWRCAPPPGSTGCEVLVGYAAT